MFGLPVGRVNSAQLIIVCKQNASFLQATYINELNCFCLSYNKHLINRAKSVFMGESWPGPCAQAWQRSLGTNDLGQNFPLQNSCSANVNWLYLTRDLKVWHPLMIRQFLASKSNVVIRSHFCFPNDQEDNCSVLSAYYITDKKRATKKAGIAMVINGCFSSQSVHRDMQIISNVMKFGMKIVWEITHLMVMLTRLGCQFDVTNNVWT